MARIHPQAIVHESADLAEDVEVGPFTIIGEHVSIGAGTTIGPHNVIKGPTRIGKNNRILQFCSIGEDTPDLKYAGEATWLIIGDNNTIREGVTLHRGTVQDRAETRIGNNNLIMAYAHVGHDCIIHDHTILVNNSALAGHVEVGDWAIISGFTGVHQYCSIGAHSFIGAYSWVTQDLPAYVLATGNPATTRTINAEGLKRRGFDTQQIRCLQRAYKTIYRRGLDLQTALTELRADSENAEVLAPLIQSIEASQRGILR